MLTLEVVAKFVTLFFFFLPAQIYCSTPLVNFSLQLLFFPTWEFTFGSFIYLYSFLNSLIIFKTVILKFGFFFFFPIKSSIWTTSRMVSLNLFISFEWGTLYCFFVTLWFSIAAVVENWTFKYFILNNIMMSCHWKSDFPFLGFSVFDQ